MDEAVQSYIDAIPPDRRPLFDHLQSLIEKRYPDAELVLSYQIPTYKVGRGRVSLGLWKNGVSVYTTDPAYIENFRAKHPSVKTGKASLNFKVTDDIPDDDVLAVIEETVEQPNRAAG